MAVMGMMDQAMARQPVNDMPQEQAGGQDDDARKLVGAVVMALQQPQMKELILGAARSGNPADGLAAVAQSLLDAIDERSGGKVPPHAVPQAALEVVDMLASLASEESEQPADPAAVMESLLGRLTTQGQQLNQGA